MTVSREPPADLMLLFQTACAIPSDINEHLPRLRDLAAQCDRVTEFGMRAGNSTVALLAGQPDSLISWDINPYAIVGPRTLKLLAVAGRTKFQPRCGDTLGISAIEETDLLFIDSLHTAKQLWAELQRHADPVERRVKKFLAFHDTATFGMRGEDGSEPGLRAVIRHFQKNHAFPLWRLIDDFQNNNGLVVLERVYA